MPRAREHSSSQTRATQARGSAGPRRRARLVYFVIGLLALVVVLSALSRWILPRTSAAEVRLGAPAPALAFTTADGVTHRLSEFHGKPVMLWFFASWCDTCQASTGAIARAFPRLQQAGLQIVQLRLYQNLGYPGPSAGAFARTFARSAYGSPAWLWGEASEEASYTFDPKGYPDVYFLIDKDGIIRAISSGPGTAIDRIQSFARRSR